MRRLAVLAFAPLLVLAVEPARAQRPVDAGSDRLFVGPTGRTVAGGEGYVGVFELFFPTVQYGVADRLQVGAAIPVIPEVALETAILSAKVGLVDTPAVALSVGTMAGVTGEGGGGALGVLYGVGTFGSADGGITLGAGYPYYRTGEDSDLVDQAVILVGGDWRVGDHAKLVSENYLVSGESSSLWSAGVRLYGERIAVDLGVVGVNDNGDAICCLPVVNLTYAFGGER